MKMGLDYEFIEQHVDRGSRVLDLGCGDGALLAQLIADLDVHGRGIDADGGVVPACIERGVPVFHGDMLEGMSMFADDSFDCVILSRTLQQTVRPVDVVREMLRVGCRAIISVPNFGYWRVRLQLLLTGHMPVTRTLPYTWYDTPNIHMLTIADFRQSCAQNGLRVVDSIFLNSHMRRLPAFKANLLACSAVFVVEK
jgi:methionine biosynthesis protein MetW